MPNTAARMAPIPDRPGWYLTLVNRVTGPDGAATEVTITRFPDDQGPSGESIVFRLGGAQPRAVIFDAAQRRVDLWEKDNHPLGAP